MATYTFTTPLSSEDTKQLKAGDTVFLNGTIYTARDAAHKRLVSPSIIPGEYEDR